MVKQYDLTNKKYGRLLVIEKDNTSKRTKWICKCKCGKMKSIYHSHLISGATTSCGCYQKEKAKEYKTKHNMTHTSLHNRWKSMKQRCLNANCKAYKNYGARGIKICDEWLVSYNVFYKWCIENGYQKGLQLDRINNNGDYRPDNCRFVTPLENSNNKRTCVYIEYNGEKHTINEWSRILNINKNTFWRYIRVKKYSIDYIINVIKGGGV